MCSDPGRSALGEHRDELLAAGLAAHPVESLEHRHVGLAGTVLLDALAAGDADSFVLRRPGEKRFDERGLAEAGVTGHEHDAAPAAEHVVEEAVEALELGLASDDGKRLLSYLRRSGSRCRAGCGHDASRLGDRQAELLDELARLAQIDGVEALGEARVDG